VIKEDIVKRIELKRALFLARRERCGIRVAIVDHLTEYGGA
jgi:hypothetical protein